MKNAQIFYWIVLEWELSINVLRLARPRLILQGINLPSLPFCWNGGELGGMVVLAVLALYCFKEESSELTEYSPSCIRVAGGGGGGTETGPHILIELHWAGSTADFFAVETLHN